MKGKVFRKAKKDYFKKQYEENIKDSRKRWAITNEMLKRKNEGKRGNERASKRRQKSKE